MSSFRDRFPWRSRRKSRANSPSTNVSSSTSPQPLQTLSTNPSQEPFTSALERFRDKLSAEERDAFDNAHSRVDAEVLFQRIKVLDDKDKSSKTRKCLGRVEQFLRLLNQLVNGVAIGIQSSPEISSLVVGGAKLIIDMAINFAAYFQKLTDMIEKLSKHLSNLEEFAKHKDIPLISQSLRDVYEGLLGFYHKAFQVFNRSHLHLRVFFESQWKPFEQTFGEINANIEHRLIVLRESSSVATLGVAVDIRKRSESATTETKERASLAERKEFLRWLSTKDFESDKAELLRKRWADTGSWILSHKHYKSWMSSSGSERLLWCSGPPGSGKSVAASIVIDQINRFTLNERPNSRLAYAYFTYQGLAQNQSETVIASLARQLAQSCDTIPDSIMGTFRDHNIQDRKPVLEVVIDIFYQFTAQLGEIFVVVDALDECHDKDKELFFAEFFYQVYKNAPSVKFLIFSRPEPTISRYLTQYSPLDIKIGGAATKSDITEYIRGQVELRTQPLANPPRSKDRPLRIKDETLKDEIVDYLSARSSGMFLWVNLQLEEVSRQTNDDDIRYVLQTLPEGLDDTYFKILERAKKDGKHLHMVVLKCLMWVTYACEELRFYELQDAIATDTSAAEVLDLNKARGKYTLEDIIDLCRGLLIAEHHTSRNWLTKPDWAYVRPVHFSLVEFLRTDPRIIDTPFSILQDSEAVQCKLATICINHLVQVCLPGGQATTLHDVLLRYTDYNRYGHPFAWYCVRYFDEHAVKARMTTSLKNVITELLSQDKSCLAALLQLRHIRRRKIVTDFRTFDISDQKIMRSIVLRTTRLADIPSIYDGSDHDLTHLPVNSLHITSAQGNTYQLEKLLESGMNPQTIDQSGNTAFIEATLRGHREAAELLLKFGANIEQRYKKETALEITAKRNDVAFVTMLLEHGAQGIEGDKTFRLALFRAVTRSVELSRRLLSYGAEPAVQTLVKAAAVGMEEVFALSLRSGIGRGGWKYDTRLVDELNSFERWDTSPWEGSTPLYCAAKWGWTDIVKLLLEYEADVNEVGGSLGTPLQAAALGGRVDIVQLMLAHGASSSINQTNERFGTALAAAAYGGHAAVVSALLDAGADVNVSGGRDGFALVASVGCIRYGRPDWDRSKLFSRVLNKNMTIPRSNENTTEQLIRAGADVPRQGSAAIARAVQNGNRVLVDLLLKHGAMFDLDSLCEASWAGHIDLVRKILKHGVNPDPLDHHGRSPLISAIVGNQVEISEILISAGVDTNLLANNDYGQSTRPLHAACAQRNLTIVRLLLDNNADPNLPAPVSGYTLGDNQMETPLLAACRSLTEYFETTTSQTPLTLPSIILLLLDKGAQVNETDGRGYTALEMACMGHIGGLDAYPVAKMLIDSGANYLTGTENHSRPLEIAAGRGHTDIVNLILGKGTIDKTSKVQALRAAVGQGHVKIVDRLIQDGLSFQQHEDLAVSTTIGHDLVHLATYQGDDMILELLVRAGAQIDAEGEYGTLYETALVGFESSKSQQGGWGKIIKHLRQENIPEPPKDCHYGVICCGPGCGGWDQELRAKPESWIRGTRFKCLKCKSFNLCSACNELIVKSKGEECSETGSKIDVEGSFAWTRRSSHQSIHKTKRIETRSTFGKEEKLGTLEIQPIDELSSELWLSIFGGV